MNRTHQHRLVTHNPLKAMDIAQPRNQNTFFPDFGLQYYFRKERNNRNNREIHKELMPELVKWKLHFGD